MLFGVVSAGIMVLIAGLLPYQAAKRFAAANDNLEHQYVTLGALDAIQTSLQTAIAELRGYMVTGDGELVERFHRALDAMHESEARAAGLLADEPEILPSFKILQQQLRAREDHLKIAESVAAGGPAAVLAGIDLRLARQQTADVTETISHIRSQLDAYTTARETKIASAFRRLQLTLTLFLISSLVTLAILYRYGRSSRERRQAALAEAEEQRRISDSIIDNAPVAIYLREAAGRTLVRVNPMMAQMSGKPIDLLLGAKGCPFGAQEIERALLAEEQSLVANRQWLSNGQFELDAPGGKLTIDVRTVLIPDPRGEVRYVLRLIDDITAQRKAMETERASAAALEQKSKALEFANRELESFSYSVSHDLRAPLRAIEGYASILAEDNATQLDEAGQRYLQNIRNGATKMGVLIENLLSFSRLNRHAMVPTDCDTPALVQNAWQAVRNAHPETKAQLTVLNLPHCRGDMHLLEQVWINLLDNAAKYSGKSEDPRITVRAESGDDGREIIFHVEDNGAGFDMRYYDKLFNVFQRLHSESQFPGTGVGLAIVQRIVTRHGGRAFARGEPGKGACFSFALPTGAPT
jgi:signal transduction histidine kinase/CHASE3 domain sensor protein